MQEDNRYQDFIDSTVLTIHKILQIIKHPIIEQYYLVTQFIQLINNKAIVQLSTLLSPALQKQLTNILGASNTSLPLQEITNLVTEEVSKTQIMEIYATNAFTLANDYIETVLPTCSVEQKQKITQLLKQLKAQYNAINS